MSRLPLAFAVASLVACGSSPEGAPAEPVAPPPVPTLEGAVAVQGVALFQGVKAPLVAGGAVVANPIPAVAARPGVVRVYVESAGQKPTRLKATVTAYDDAGGIRAVGATAHSTASTTPSDDVPSSYFDVALPATAFTAGGGLRVTLQEVTPLDAPTATAPLAFPAEGSPIALPIRRTSAHLEVRFVPVRYTAEGQDLLPIVTDSGLAAYEQQLLATYPISSVHVALREAGEVVWDKPIDADGDGWGEALGAILEARQKDAPSDDVYYVGLFRSRPNFGAYCRGGCVLGLAAGIPGPADAEERAALAIGYDAATGAETVAHELGHVHGRRHSPCGGAAGPDPRYPNKDGSLDTLGWDLRDGTFIDGGYDLMGYCNPAWVSAFTWRALSDRIDAIARLAPTAPAPSPAAPPAPSLAGRPSQGGPVVAARPYTLVQIARDGRVTAARPTTRRGDPQGEPIPLRAASGETLTGAYFPYDDVGGGYLLVPGSRPAGALTPLAPVGPLPAGRPLAL